MKSKLKEAIKVKFPRIYEANHYIFRKLSEKINVAMSFVNYANCLYAHKPYLGSYLEADQSGKKRKPYMVKSVELGIKGLKDNRFRILEIGSWAGASAILWAESIKRLNAKGLVTCVDPWSPFIDLDVNVGVSKRLHKIEQASKGNKIYNLFLHNIKATGHNDIIKPYRGNSDELLPTLRNIFNLVYIDGSHFYSQVIKDLQNCGRLVVEGGFLCGDDLEMQKHEVDVENAEERKEQDCILDLKTKQVFHPGVSLAIAEFFKGEVSCFEGFWIMKKKGAGWEKVELS